MRSEENPLDLNNLPEDYTKDGKQVLEDSSSYAGTCRKKKSGAKDGKDECGKVYECRFCSLKFCKSQALGGHMNRHRQERETETLNRARQLVFNNDNTLLAPGAHLGQPIPHGAYHQPAGNIGGDPTLQTFRSIYPARVFSGSSSSMLPPQQGQPPSQSPYMYTSPSRLVPFPSQYPANEYFVGHVLPTGNNPQTIPQQESSNYTCIGAPVGSVGHGFVSNNGNNIRGCEAAAAAGGGGGGGGVNGSGGGGNSSGGREMSLYHHEEGLSWGGRTCTGTQQRLDPSSINRFQDGF